MKTLTLIPQPEIESEVEARLKFQASLSLIVKTSKSPSLDPVPQEQFFRSFEGPSSEVVHSSPACTQISYRLLQRFIKSQPFGLTRNWEDMDQRRQAKQNLIAELADNIESKDISEYSSLCRRELPYEGKTPMIGLDLVDEIYQRLVQDGAPFFMTCNGAPMFILACSYEASRILIKEYPDHKRDLKFKENCPEYIKNHPFKYVVAGFALWVTVKLPRYTLDGDQWKEVPFYIQNEPNRVIVNPGYQSALGEDLIVFSDEVMERVPGDLGFIQIDLLMVEGEQACFRACLTGAWKPISPRAGMVVRALRNKPEYAPCEFKNR